MADTDTKVCTGCGETKPLTAFVPDKLGAGGRTSRCRACRNKAKSDAYHQAKAATCNGETSGNLRWPVVRIPLMPELPGRAACRDEDPELFFPTSRKADVLAAERREAKAVCARCGVRSACAAWALEHEDAGVWGGLDDDDRKAMRKQVAA